MSKIIAYEIVRIENVMKCVKDGFDFHGFAYYSEYEGDVQIMVKYQKEEQGS